MARYQVSAVSVTGRHMQGTYTAPSPDKATAAFLARHQGIIFDPDKWKVREARIAPSINKILEQNKREGDPGQLIGKHNTVGDYRSHVFLQAVRLDAIGRAADGTYWGHGEQSLYCAFTRDLMNEVYLRASSQAEARKVVIRDWPGLRLAMAESERQRAQASAARLGVDAERTEAIANMILCRAPIEDIAVALKGRAMRKKTAARGDVLYVYRRDKPTVILWQRKYWVDTMKHFVAMRHAIFDGAPRR